MASITTTMIEQRLERLSVFLKPYLNFINCHMVNYFTDNHWEKLISKELRNEINEAGRLDNLVQTLINNGYCSDLNNQYPLLAKLMESTRSNTLFEMSDICLTIDNFRESVLPRDLQHRNPLPIKEFMSPKKNHEVSLMSSIVASLCSGATNEKILIIDAGDGKGYLSSRLALEYKLPVIGIDSSQTNTYGAKKRSEKLERAWNVLVDRAEKEKAGTLQKGRRKNKRTKTQCTGRNETNDLYKTVTQFIEADTNFHQLVREYFPDQDFATYCLTGLHTCGNLAPNCLNIFRSNEAIRIVCNVGCCFHLLDEVFLNKATDLNLNRFHQNRKLFCSSDERTGFRGFPLSNYLKQQKFFLGRNARMLASQSVSRFFAEQKLPQKSLLYRAMLQILIERCLTPEESENLLVGKSKSNTFPDYVQTSFKKFNMKCPTIEEILAVEGQYCELWSPMQLFYIIRLLFAPVIETLIILDRLLYLKENSYDRSYVVQMFDPVLSPRCFGIVSIK